jgi:cytoskeleton protein RodZ
MGMARGNFGERLKRERELREVTLEEITSATRIGPRFLEALENEEWEKLPGGVFNRGFVRSVARYLGLDEEAFLAEYDLAHGTQVLPAEEREKNKIPAAPRWIPAVVFLGGLIILAGLVAAGFYGWRYYQARRSVRQSQASSSSALPQPIVPAPPPATAAPTAQSHVPSVPVALDLSISAGAATHLLVWLTATQFSTAICASEKIVISRPRMSLKSSPQTPERCCWN